MEVPSRTRKGLALRYRTHLARSLPVRNPESFAVLYLILVDDRPVGAANRVPSNRRTEDETRPAGAGNFWGPSRDPRQGVAGQLPPLPMNPATARWGDWGRSVLREGDIVFRMGDARACAGMFPLSRFIAKATGSAFSHTGIVTIEDVLARCLRQLLLGHPALAVRGLDAQLRQVDGCEATQARARTPHSLECLSLLPL